MRDGATLRKELLHHKIYAWKLNKVFIPDSLIAEMEQFASRNMLSNIIGKEFLTEEPKEVCPSCLKAHALMHASRLGLPRESREFLDSILPGNKGHNGYYLDGEKIVKIEEE